MAADPNMASLLLLFWISGIIFSRPTQAVACIPGAVKLLHNCEKFIVKDGPELLPPSAECCDAVMQADIACVCLHVTKDVEEVIDMHKAVYIVGYCGSPLPDGYQCGSYKVPMSCTYGGGC